MVELFAKLGPGDFHLGLMRRAWHWADSARMPYWDGLIVALAEAEGCSYLVSEDFSRGGKPAK